MNTTAGHRKSRMTRPAATLAALSVLGLSLTLLVTPALATHVTPTPISEGNPTCSDFAPQGESWTQFKLEGGDLADGTYSDGTLEVTISNYVNSSSGTPGAFDWSSNIGVDAVFVKAGSDKHNLYVYDPEETSDTGLGPQAGSGNGISHISFCYDVDEETPTPTPEESVAETATPTPTPTPEESVAETATPTPTPTPEESVAETATPTPEGSVEGSTGTPEASLPDGAMSQMDGSNPLPTVLFGLLLLASVCALAVANVKTVRSRS